MTAAHLMKTYSPQPVAFARGEGAWLWDTEGKKYLDALAGIAVSGLGHGHPVLTRALAGQAGRLIHTSNLFRVVEQERAAQKVCELAGMDNAFFCNSGAEANECAIKLARLHGHQRGIENPSIVVMEKAWHGRTLATLSATGSRKAQAGFEPLMGGFLRVPYNDIGAIERLSEHPSVVAVLLEVLQGEGGIHVADREYLRKLRELCDRRQWLLMIDEVQSGIGRTGRMFAAHHTGVVPDIMTLAKGLGSGMPIGLVVAKKRHMELWKRGAHGNTYGGNPVCCAAAIATLDLVEREYMANAAEVGAYFMRRLREWQSREPRIGEVRGHGLFIGMELVAGAGDRTPARQLCDDLVTRAYHNGLLLLSCGVSTVRFMPPLLISRADVDEAMTILEESLAEATAAGARA